ncbi:MAG TPA: molybdopterin-dependent oxidoreductase [Acidobacteriota bacterium]|nr:molybdopterin-dependent oxidoreductase [Acidobacteriota bacterium]
MNTDDSAHLNRRSFLAALAGAGAAGVQLGCNPFEGAGGFDSIVAVDNPLAAYPDRNWESIYRDQYNYDRSFTWVCAPNDTHMCRMRAFVRNGVIVRMEQNYDVQKYGDLYGNRSTEHWNPRGCPKGYTFHRRIYGPYRAKGPVLRQGWKDWADAGFPSLSDDPSLRTRFRFDDRGNDTFVSVSWDEAASYVARGLTAIAETYSGDEGQRRLRADGCDEEMFTHWEEAGTRTMKIGSCLPLHGLVGKFGIFRFANLLGLLDHHVRGVDADEAKGPRDWTEYTWRGDQAPGTPFATGLQTSDIDLNDLRHSRLHIQVGKNLVENKMPEAHWFIEGMERGMKIWSIAPEYNAPGTKADEWLSVRPGLSDLAVFLGVARILIDEDLYDEDFVKRFTDLPLLVRTDTLERLRPEEIIAGYELKPLTASYEQHGLTDEQREQIGDFVVYDSGSESPVAISREDIGDNMQVDPALAGRFTVETLDGQSVEVMPIMEMYRIHLRDYDLETVEEISGAPAEKVRELAMDIATLKPAAIHFGEGINHYFHATLHNRVCFFVMMLTGNYGVHGAGVCTWAGNYKGGLFQASPWSGPGAGTYTHEDPFNPVLDEDTRITHEHLRNTTKGEEVSYWAYGDQPLIVNTPEEGRKLFTGRTHLPTPTKLIWYNNANFLNQAKWIYEIVQNVNPKVDMIVDQQIEWTGSAEYSDVILPANSWAEFEDLEIGGSCSNPFIQAWGGDGIDPIYDSKDDGAIFAAVADALTEQTGDQRFADYFRFVTEKKSKVYIQRVLDNCSTTRGEDGPYSIDRMMEGEYGGEPGAALFLFRTYPRVPFWEQIHDSVPVYTDCGRFASYCDLPEAIDYGENLIVHREAVEATPYLPNVIVSTSPFIRPRDYGIPLSAVGADERTVRNVKMAWDRVKETVNPLWERGYQFYCSTPKSRHTTHSSWSVVDWHWIWSTNFGDPLRVDKRAPGVSDRQIQMNPQAAMDLGLEDGDYVYVDANAADRPYVGWRPGDAAYHAYRCMVRVKFSPGLPYTFTIMKHTGWIATPRTVKAHEDRADGRALAADTGYQSSYRYGSHQSITRNWLMPMHQTDGLFHKKAAAMAFVFGFEVDNHAVNTVPKETLIKITKAEPGGVGGTGVWGPARSGFSPGHENPTFQAYLDGALTKTRRG